MTTPTQLPDVSDESSEPKTGIGEVSLDNAHIEVIHGDIVHVNQSSVSSIDADEVEMVDSHAHQIDTDTLTARDSMINEAHAETITLSDSAVGAAYATEATINGHVGAVFSQAVTLNDEGHTGFMIAREVHGDRIQSSILLAGQVNAPVETTMDTRSALIFGAAAGAVLGTFLGVLGLILRRR